MMTLMARSRDFLLNYALKVCSSLRRFVFVKKYMSVAIKKIPANIARTPTSDHMEPKLPVEIIALYPFTL